MSNERLLETFLDLVRIESPSGSEAAVARYCERALAATGCCVRFDASQTVTGSDCGNLIAELPGTVPGVLVISAHMDTVGPCEGVEPHVVDGLVVSLGDTILGADDKSGIAAAIEAVRTLVESGEPRPTIRCVFTVQEEVGLRGAKALDPADVAGDLCIVLDADGAPGGIVLGAPTHYTFAADFIGRAAHAGVAPEKGVSAISMASAAICDMTLGRLDETTTANVGSIAGGAATNVVTAKVTVTGECRSLTRDRVESVRADLDRAMREAAAQAGGSVDIVWNCEYEGFLLDARDPAVGVATAACADAGLVARTFTTGGGSDANIIAALGVSTLALSCGMAGVHSTDEQIAIADLEAVAALVIAIARRMAA